MIAAALVTEAQRTEQTLTTLIILLLVVAGLMTVLTIWYWVYTSPRRRRRLHQRWLEASGEVPVTTVPGDHAATHGAPGDGSMEVDIRGASGPPMRTPNSGGGRGGGGFADPHEAITQTIPAVGGDDRVGQPYRP